MLIWIMYDVWSNVSFTLRKNHIWLEMWGHLRLLVPTFPPWSSWWSSAPPPSPSRTHRRWRTRSPPSSTLGSASFSGPESRSATHPARPPNWSSQWENWRLAFRTRTFSKPNTHRTCIGNNANQRLNHCIRKKKGKHIKNMCNRNILTWKPRCFQQSSGRCLHVSMAVASRWLAP